LGKVVIGWRCGGGGRGEHKRFTSYIAEINPIESVGKGEEGGNEVKIKKKGWALGKRSGNLGLYINLQQKVQRRECHWGHEDH